MAVVTLTATGDATAEATTTNVGSAQLEAPAMFSAYAIVSEPLVATLTADVEEVAFMAAGQLDITIEQGATYAQTYTVTDDGFTWDGWTARSQIRSAPADQGSVLLDLTPYLTVTGADIQLVVPADVTQTLTRNGVWDLEMVNGDTVARILQGRVAVSLEVTRL